MKKQNKKSKNPVALILYVVAILLAVYTIFTMYNSYTYISGLIAQGLVVKDELVNVISYFTANSVPAFFFTVATCTMGYIVGKLHYISCDLKKENTEELSEEIVKEVAEEEMNIESIDDLTTEM